MIQSLSVELPQQFSFQDAHLVSKELLVLISLEAAHLSMVKEVLIVVLALIIFVYTVSLL